MPVLTFVNKLGSDVAIGNPDGFGAVFTIPSAGKTVTLTGIQLESVGPQLDAMKAKGYITWTKAQNPAVSDSVEILSGNPAPASLLAAVVPEAKGANVVHATVFGDAVGPVSITTGLTNPTTARNLQLAMGATYDGGNVTVTGTNQFDQVATETFTAGTTVTRIGNVMFKTVTKVAYAGGGVGTHGTNTLDVGTGDKIAIVSNVVAAVGLLYTDGAVEAVTIDATNDSFLPTTVPNGTHSYVLLVDLAG